MASTANAEPPGWRRGAPCAAHFAGLLADSAYLLLTVVAAAVGLVGIGYLIGMTVAQTGDVWSTYCVWGS